ncbi:MAG: RNA polymerase sigma factor [Candidatus Paceibacterota bacterium]
MSDNEKLSDEEIVEKVRSSDQEFYTVIIERYQNKLLRYATNLIKDEHKAIDVVQESFIKAFINLNGFNIKKKFSSWIYRIVHNEAINAVKKYYKEIPMPEDVDFQSEENIEDDFFKKEIITKVEKCLGKMPLLYSEPLTLRYIEDKSYEEISDILRIPMGTVAIHISRAKILMKHICQKN